MNRKYITAFHYLILLAFLSSCATYSVFFEEKYLNQGTAKTQNNERLLHSLYLVGGADESKEINLPSGQLLAELISKDEGENTLLLLGNNSTKLSFTDTLFVKRRGDANRILKTRYQFFKNLKGGYYAIPGTHVWADGTKKGSNSVRLWEYYVEEKLGFGDVVFPNEGCPGPEEIHINDDLVLLLIDTQWFLHEWSKPGKSEGCGVDNEMEFLVALDDAIKRNHRKKIVVVGHHSMSSQGPHGGKFPVKTHFFPFTESVDDLYVPLPGIGTLYVWYRQLLGNMQDHSFPKYKRMVKSFEKVFAQHTNLIYTSAHELSLEYHKENQQHYVNSGSFAKNKPIGKKNAEFAGGVTGFGKLSFYESGDVWLEFWQASELENKLLYKQKLFNAPIHDPSQFQKKIKSIDYSDSVITTVASKAYEKNKKRPGMLGNNYRKEWAASIENVPYFEIDNEHGGLEIVQRGGGMQTKSLRLENEDEKQYVLRSIEKYPENAVPAELRGTIASDVIAEQISSSHPYGAFVVPEMAQAVGVYHTNPQLVYLPDDPRLGIYQKDFGNGLYLYEERPAKNRKDVDSFGNSKRIINTFDVLKNTKKDGDHYVDEMQVLKSRLFDILIGDWDRHEDQWRWARFKDDNDFYFYQPIPRDRDQAFFWSDGWLMKLATKRWGMPKFQGFHHEIRDVSGFCFNARYFDRSFLVEPEKRDWIRVAKEIQQSVTDEVIEHAIKGFPPEIFNLHGETIISKLKSRREKLVEYGEEYYLFLAKNVNILGTDKSDLFDIERLNDEETLVRVFRTKEKSGEIRYQTYERTFKTSETQEIRLYGFDDTDRFHIAGTVNKGIRIRIIGGDEKDIIKDDSRVTGWGKKTIVYDNKKSTQIIKSAETKNKTRTNDPMVNLYTREEFKYNITMPLVYASFNPDDGVFIGLGATLIRQGFRKEPFKSKHSIKADIAPKSQSFDFSYKGIFTDVLGKWDLKINANLYSPSYTDFFYGYGNETVFDEEKFEIDKGYYRARYKQYILYPELEWRSDNENHTFLVGGGYQSVIVPSELNDLNQEQPRFIIDYANSLPYQLLDVRRHFIGLYVNYTFDKTNSSMFPQEGFRWNIDIYNMQDVDNSDYTVQFSRLHSNIAYYYTFGNSLRTTIALRGGGSRNFGDFEFYHAPRLGGTTNFRGVRKFRFAGDGTVYQNTDLRIKLLSFKSPVVPGDFGITVFHDFGRVWYDNDPSNAEGASSIWHRGMGGGIWLAPLSKAALALDYSWSTLDESAFFLRLGFMF